MHLQQLKRLLYPMKLPVKPLKHPLNPLLNPPLQLALRAAAK